MTTNAHLWPYLAHFFLEWEMFQTTVVEKIKTIILCSITFFWTSFRLWDNMEKFGRARQMTWGYLYNASHAHCVMDNYVCRHTVRICNIYCFSFPTMVTRTRHNVAFYVHFLSFYLFLPHKECTRSLQHVDSKHSQNYLHQKWQESQTRSI
jgi:hypothetical protein